MATTTHGFYYPGPTDVIDDLEVTLQLVATSAENAFPVKTVATLSTLNGMTGTLYPDGTLAVLTAVDSGLNVGATFRRVGGKWVLSGGAQVSAVGTFTSALASFANLQSGIGSTFWDATALSSGMWTSTAGAYKSLATKTIVTGSGAQVAVSINGASNHAITFPVGSFTAPPSAVFTNTGSGRLTTAVNSITATGFTMNVNNWSNAKSSATTFYWTAIQ